VPLDWEGRFIAANRQARFFLQDLPIAPGQPFERVFRTSFDRFLAESAATASGQLTDHRGSTYKVIGSSLPYSSVTIRGANLQNEKRRETGTIRPAFICEDPVVLEAIRIVERAIPWRVPIFILGRDRQWQRAPGQTRPCGQRAGPEICRSKLYGAPGDVGGI
jgi:hypothetical protein